MELPEFLLARFAEDEDEAREQAKANRSDPQRFWPRRLARCKAERRIVEQFQQAEADDEMPAEWNDGYVCGLEFTLRLLALPYADHSDYRQEWKP